MSPQILALIAACYGLLGGMILYGLIDFLRKGGGRDLRKWLDAEIECNVKLLKENEGLEERNNSLVEHHCSHHSEFFFSTEGASEEASAVPGHVDTLASSLSAHPCATYGHKFTHSLTPRRCVYCDLPEVSA